MMFGTDFELYVIYISSLHKRLLSQNWTMFWVQLIEY